MLDYASSQKFLKHQQLSSVKKTARQKLEVMRRRNNAGSSSVKKATSVQIRNKQYRDTNSNKRITKKILWQDYQQS